MRTITKVYLNYQLIFFGILFLLLATGTNSQTLVVPPSPGNLVAAGIAHLTQSNDYTVEVKKSGDANYTTCFVYKTDNYASDYWGSEHKPQTAASFTNFSFSGTSVDVRVTTSFTASSALIRPLNFNIPVARNGNVITFTLTSPKKIFVEVNNQLNPLFIFADAPDVVPAPGDVTYFYGPGIHKIGLHKQINSNESVYIAGGAVVQGTFYLPSGTDNVNVWGRGIITGGNLPTAVQRTNDLDSISKYAVFTASKFTYPSGYGTVTTNFSIEGITMVNTCGTHFAMVNTNHGNYNNSFRNLKEVDWSVNTDNVFDGDNNIVDDCFFFINDDCTVTRCGNNLRITNSVFWTWLGRMFWCGGYGSTSDNLWENIEMIGHDKGPLVNNISSSGTSGIMKNFTFRNITIEAHPINVEGYADNKFIYMKSSSTTKIENWMFDNVSLDTKNPDEGDFIGNSVGTIDVTFRNLKMGGVYINSLANSNMSADAYSSIQFELAPEMNIKQGSTNITDGSGSYNFGSVTSGSSKTVTFTIENLGGATLNLTGSPRVSVTGTGFSRIVDAATTVSSGGTTTFQVRFAPTTSGSFTGTISIANNDTDENPYNFTISGTGTVANLVTNPTFNTNTTDWECALSGGAAATIASVSKTGFTGMACKATITNGSTAPGYVQLRQTIPVTSGKTYTLTFKASADAVRSIAVAFQQNVTPWTTWKTFSGINLTTTPTAYGPYTFACTTTDATNMLKFMLGNSSTDVYIDDVVLTESSSLKSSEVISETDLEVSMKPDAITIYPNPVSDLLKVEAASIAGNRIVVELFDLQGRMVLSGTQTAAANGLTSLQLDVKPLNAGIYLIKVMVDNVVSKSAKIVVQK